MNLLLRLLAHAKAQDLAEYGIALAMITLGAGLAAIAIAGNLSTVWSTANSLIALAIH